MKSSGISGPRNAQPHRHNENPRDPHKAHKMGTVHISMCRVLVIYNPEHRETRSLTYSCRLSLICTQPPLGRTDARRLHAVWTPVWMRPLCNEFHCNSILCDLLILSSGNLHFRRRNVPETSSFICDLFSSPIRPLEAANHGWCSTKKTSHNKDLHSPISSWLKDWWAHRILKYTFPRNIPHWHPFPPPCQRFTAQYRKPSFLQPISDGILTNIYVPMMDY